MEATTLDYSKVGEQNSAHFHVQQYPIQYQQQWNYQQPPQQQYNYQQYAQPYPMQYPVQYPPMLQPMMHRPLPPMLQPIPERTTEVERVEPIDDTPVVHSVDGRCYSCNPRGKVKKHIISMAESKSLDRIIFHHDMHKRPIIIVTTGKHITNITELKDGEYAALYKAINDFCVFWKLEDCQISYNTGKWKTNDHFHIKIRSSDTLINKMRKDHFTRMTLESKYC